MPRGYPKNPKKAAKRGPKPKSAGPQKLIAKDQSSSPEKGIGTSPSFDFVFTSKERFGVLATNIQVLGSVRAQLKDSVVATAQAQIDSEIVEQVKALGQLRKQCFGAEEKTVKAPPAIEVPPLPANGIAAGTIPPMPSPVTLPVPSAPSAS